jgi:uncharacterized protein YkwD
VTRFARRATTLAAALIAAPLGFALVTATGPQALAAGAPFAAGVVSVVGTVGSAASGVGPDAVAAKAHVSKKKKKKKKQHKAQPPVTTTPAAGGPTALETEVVTLTNTFRTANGCGALRIDNRLVTAARAHSTDMVTRNFFDHTGSDGSSFVQREVAAGYTTGASAENIAWGYRTPQDVVTGWINSPGHRANMLNCASVAVGVGLAYKADGTPYWTQDFGRV